MNEKPKIAPTKKRRLLTLPPYVYLGYLLLCTLLVTGVSFSSYLSQASGSDSARVAAGAISITTVSGSSVTLDNTNGPASGDLTFTVSNINAGAVSEVAIRYDIVIQADLPAGVTMTLDGKRGSQSGDTYTFSNMGTFAAGEERTFSHTLTFTGDFTAINDSSTSNIDISVQAEQID
ncbi:MAG: hypothetical protein UDG94_00520 [Peptococcaceae bacterium]|nr:hypothetical protein [Peptococcaceae bacterium]